MIIEKQELNLVPAIANLYLAENFDPLREPINFYDSDNLSFDFSKRLHFNNGAHVIFYAGETYSRELEEFRVFVKLKKFQNFSKFSNFFPPTFYLPTFLPENIQNGSYFQTEEGEFYYLLLLSPQYR